MEFGKDQDKKNTPPALNLNENPKYWARKSQKSPNIGNLKSNICMRQSCLALKFICL